MSKKICLVISSLNQGGSEKVMLNFAKILISSNFFVDLIVIKNVKNEYILNEKYKNLKIIRLNKKNSLSSIFKITRLFFRNNYKFIISSLMHINVITSISNFLVFQKYNLFLRETNIQSLNLKSLNAFKRIIMILLSKFFYNRNIVIFPTELIYNDFKNKIFNIKKYIILPNPYIDENNDLILKVKNSNFNFDSNKKYLLNIGSLENKKNHSFLINNFIKIFQYNKNIILLIIGEGSLKKKLQNKINKLQLQNNILLVGNVSNIEYFYQNSSLYVCSSKWEGLSNVLIEASFNNLPIVSVHKLSGLDLILDNYKYGLILKNISAEDLLHAVKLGLNKKIKIPPIEYLKKTFDPKVSINKIISHINVK